MGERNGRKRGIKKMKKGKHRRGEKEGILGGDCFPLRTKMGKRSVTLLCCP